MNAAADPLPPARGADPATGEVDPPALDPRVLAGLRQLDPGHDKQLMTRVLLTYRDSLARQRGQAQLALGRGDLATVQLAVHTLKSASASIGARGLALVCGTVEAAARGGDRGECAALMARMNAEADRVDAAVQQTLTALPGPTP